MRTPEHILKEGWGWWPGLVIPSDKWVPGACQLGLAQAQEWGPDQWWIMSLKKVCIKCICLSIVSGCMCVEVRERPFHSQNRSLIGFSFKNTTPRCSSVAAVGPQVTRPAKPVGFPASPTSTLNLLWCLIRRCYFGLFEINLIELTFFNFSVTAAAIQ